MQTACRSLRRCRPVFSITTGRKRKQKSFYGGKRSVCCRNGRNRRFQQRSFRPFRPPPGRPRKKKAAAEPRSAAARRRSMFHVHFRPAAQPGASCGPGKIKMGNPLQPYNDRNLFSAPTAACVCRPPGFRLQSRWLPARSRCAIAAGPTPNRAVPFC